MTRIIRAGGPKSPYKPGKLPDKKILKAVLWRVRRPFEKTVGGMTAGIKGRVLTADHDGKRLLCLERGVSGRSFWTDPPGETYMRVIMTEGAIHRFLESDCVTYDNKKKEARINSETVEAFLAEDWLADKYPSLIREILKGDEEFYALADGGGNLLQAVIDQVLDRLANVLADHLQENCWKAEAIK